MVEILIDTIVSFVLQSCTHANRDTTISASLATYCKERSPHKNKQRDVHAGQNVHAGHAGHDVHLGHAGQPKDGGRREWAISIASTFRWRLPDHIDPGFSPIFG